MWQQKNRTLVSFTFLKGWVITFQHQFKGGPQIFVQLLRGGLPKVQTPNIWFSQPTPSFTLWPVPEGKLDNWRETWQLKKNLDNWMKTWQLKQDLTTEEKLGKLKKNLTTEGKYVNTLLTVQFRAWCSQNRKTLRLMSAIMGGKLKSRINTTQVLGYTWNQKNLKQES
jgi:hypothetical protein